MGISMGCNGALGSAKPLEKGMAELKDILLSEVMLLKMKKSGKELDPKFFDNEEKKLYEER